MTRGTSLAVPLSRNARFDIGRSQPMPGMLRASTYLFLWIDAFVGSVATARMILSEFPHQECK
jgi:hypothetical protein